MKLLFSHIEDEVLSDDPPPADGQKSFPRREHVLSHREVLEPFCLLCMLGGDGLEFRKACIDQHPGIAE